jgi:hypothetical protein
VVLRQQLLRFRDASHKEDLMTGEDALEAVEDAWGKAMRNVKRWAS